VPDNDIASSAEIIKSLNVFLNDFFKECRESSLENLISFNHSFNFFHRYRNVGDAAIAKGMAGSRKCCGIFEPPQRRGVGRRYSKIF